MPEDDGGHTVGEQHNGKAVVEIGSIRNVDVLVSVPKKYSEPPGDAGSALTGHGVNWADVPAGMKAAPGDYDYTVHISGDAKLGRRSSVSGSTQGVFWMSLIGTGQNDEQSIRIVVDGEEYLTIPDFGPHSQFQHAVSADEIRIEVNNDE